MTIVVILHVLILVGFGLRILIRDDLEPPVRLAWMIVLLLLPFIGAIVYFLFGEVDPGHTANRRHDEVCAEMRDRGTVFLGDRGVTDELVEARYRPAFHYCASINGFHAVPGNRAELMADAEETNRRLIADIDAATDHVHVLYYIWLTDTTGTDVARALIRAAERGVTCRALADGLGSRAFIRSDLWREMADAGVQLGVALPIRNPLWTMITSRIDLRNHRKITVIDGAVTYCGSRNSADPEFRVKPKYAPWVDIMLRFTGPVVSQNQLLFASDWAQATGQSIDVIPVPRQPADPAGFAAQVMGDGPTERQGATPQLFATLIASAHHRLTMSTPYFVPDETVVQALMAAAFRGVEVTMIFPENNDSWVVGGASRSYYRQLLDAGVVIHEFSGGLLHAKTLTIDDTITLIGSTNVDLRSFDLNYENNILIHDDGVTAAVQARQSRYIEDSRTVTLEEVLDWSLAKRAWNNILATIGPVL
ncbi:cardiolipin synthase [Corynebacterium sp. P7003]|uniref:Cardiolipin synthase n=1 Tax=Corynebacterium pygosceleis TaxID=2800406 RepID=A0ABT3WUY1_9CORY|nr:cardiolipin synthase [Corynebacterium pygosceleis]MCX7444784.1 cardiolipin synthase [Corynebacterium pygosceleis]